MHYLLVFIGGGVGSMARLATSSLYGKYDGIGLPFGTLTVNLVGSFIIGLIIEVLALKFSAPDNLRYLLVTGFLGGYTTFSAFSLECSSMLARGDYLNMISYSLISVIGAILMVVLATYLVRVTF